MTRAAFSVATLLTATLTASAAHADVTPAEVYLRMWPGTSRTVMTYVDAPTVPAQLDVFFLIDVTGSFFDDLPNLRDLAPGLADDIRSIAPDSRFGLASFADFPFEPFGSRSSDDYAYRIHQDLTDDLDLWLQAVDGLQLQEGGDLPESQYEALFQAATGAGLEIPLFADGDFDDLGEIAPGQGASFRANASKVIVLLTDTSFHNPGDTCSVCPIAYPGAGRDDVVIALRDAGIRVIAVKGPGASQQMDDIAEATFGAVRSTTGDSSDLDQAIASGLQSIGADVVPQPGPGCAPLDLAFDPVDLADPSLEDIVLFDELVTVPSSIDRSVLDRRGRLTCVIDYVAGGQSLGTQTLNIKVPKRKKAPKHKHSDCRRRKMHPSHGWVKPR